MAQQPPGHGPTCFMCVYLLCVAEAPSFIRSPPPAVKIAETQSTLLPCNVVGTPTPHVVWKTGSPSGSGRLLPLYDDESDAERFVVNETGDLLIKVDGIISLRANFKDIGRFPPTPLGYCATSFIHCA